MKGLMKPMLAHMITVSESLEGYTLVENIGIVTGLAIRTKTIDNIAAWHIQSLLGARSLTYHKLAHSARQLAYDDMIKNAEELGANAIIGVRYDSNEVARGTAEIFCYGSAVKVTKKKTAE